MKINAKTILAVLGGTALAGWGISKILKKDANDAPVDDVPETEDDDVEAVEDDE